MKLLRPGARLPARATDHSSGFDIRACLEGPPLGLGQLPVLVPTGLAIEVPAGVDAQLRPRSGLARAGVMATFGTLDADYRGEVFITMYTSSPAVSHEVRDGDRIAQLVVARLAEVRLEAVTELSPTPRGSGGHGSTGR